MKRTKFSDDPIQVNQLQTLSELVSRVNLAARLGQSYSGDRDIYQALGYPLDLTYLDYATRYLRQDIARAIIDRPVKVTWRGPLEIIESDDDKETALEKAWEELEDRLGVKSRLMRLDKLTGIGHYGVLLLGLNDVRGKEGYANPVVGNTNKLIYLKPLGEGDAVISKWESRSANERYGMPTEYDIKITDTASGMSNTIKVHWTRVLHVVDEMLESEVKGCPRLQPVFNRLMDLEKLIGGSAEMFWRGARPGFQGKLDKDFTMDSTTKTDLKDQLDEYEHNLRRILVNEGVELHPLAMQVAEVGNHVDVQIQMISAETGIPKRILTGSERGELSSSQDQDEWNAFVQSRREEYAEPRIVRPFVDICIKYGILPPPVEGAYDVKWADLFAQSEKEKVEVGGKRAEALAKYVNSPMGEAVIPPDTFLEKFLGFDKEDVELIQEQRNAVVDEERLLSPEEEVIEEEVISGKENKPVTMGSKGSGNFGHEGRPGKVGGSGPGGTSEDNIASDLEKSYSEAMEKGEDDSIPYELLSKLDKNHPELLELHGVIEQAGIHGTSFKDENQKILFDRLTTEKDYKLYRGDTRYTTKNTKIGDLLNFDKKPTFVSRDKEHSLYFSGGKVSSVVVFEKGIKSLRRNFDNVESSELLRGVYQVSRIEGDEIIVNRKG